MIKRSQSDYTPITADFQLFLLYRGEISEKQLDGAACAAPSNK